MYMTYTLTLTSQGQVSIPAELRRLWNLTGGKQITLTLTGKRAMIEPTLDLLEYVKTLKRNPNINKGLTLDQILAKEQKAIEDGWVEHYLNKEKRSGNKILTI